MISLAVVIQMVTTDALLKTIGINENVLQGIDNALRSSMQIKGIVKMSAMLSEQIRKNNLICLMKS